MLDILLHFSLVIGHLDLTLVIKFGMNTSGCNIGSKTLLAEWGKLPLKFTCPTSTSTCPATMLNKLRQIKASYIVRTENNTCLKQCIIVLLAIVCQMHLQLTVGQVVMMHAELSQTKGQSA